MERLRTIVFLFAATNLVLRAGPVQNLVGEIRASFYLPSGEIQRSEEMQYTMLTDGTRYHIRLAKPGEDISSDHVEIAWDGTNSYYLDTVASWVKSQHEKGIVVGDNVATACITTNAVPQFFFAETASILWCAFISPSYLENKSQNELVLTPFSSFMKDNRPATTYDFLEFNALWRLSQKRNFTEEIIFVNNTSGPNAVDSFTNASFKTLAYTNIGGDDIPSEAVVTLYAKNSNGVRKTMEYLLKVNSSAEADQDSNNFQPTLPGLTVVTEERFDSPNANLHFMYSIKTNWLSMAQVKATKIYQQAATILPSPPEKKHHIPRLVIIILLVLAVAPLILVLKGHKVQRAFE